MPEDRHAQPTKRVEKRSLWQEYHETYGFPAGAWFLLRDRDTNFGIPPSQTKSRPWIVARGDPATFGVQAFPRSKTWTSTFPHDAHTKCDNSCMITCPGWIHVWDVSTHETTLFRRKGFSCIEPDEDVTRRVVAAYEELELDAERTGHGPVE